MFMRHICIWFQP